MEKRPTELIQLQKISEYVSEIWEITMRIASMYIDPG
jgi:hypothetical protein